MASEGLADTKGREACADRVLCLYIPIEMVFRALGMRIFLSYARVNEGTAAEVQLALRAEGHEVFFDRASLKVGHSFHSHIREQINSADALVFLVSPASARRGSYALTELKFAQQRWPSPAGRILPVLVEPTPLESLPAYLRSVTVLDPVGNMAAEVAAAVSSLGSLATDPTRSSVRVLIHLAGFVDSPERAAFFINITNLGVDRETEVTHVWMETSPRTHVTPDARPLPVRLRPFESWETWIYFDQLPSIPNSEVFELGRVRLSTGEVFASTASAGVPELGFVPGEKPS